MLHITRQQIKHHQLTDEIATALADNAAVNDTLGEIGMQPTSQAWLLASSAALSVLLAHHLSNGLNLDDDAPTPPPRKRKRPSPAADAQKAKQESQSQTSVPGVRKKVRGARSPSQSHPQRAQRRRRAISRRPTARVTP